MSTADNSKLATIKLGISLLFKPGQLVEFRIRNTEGYWKGFYFTDHEALAEAVERLDSDPRVISLYYVINPVKPSFIRERAKTDPVIENPNAAQVESILSGPSAALTKNEDIETLNWMFIDVDTTRMPELAGIPERKKEFDDIQHQCSTKEEKAAAKAVAIGILNDLEEKKWPQPLLGDSGNGFHILCKLNMMNSSHNIHMLVDCLKSIAAKHNSPVADVDCAVFNASRLTRAYGTTTRKGTNTEERPFRPNRLLRPMQPIQEVSLDQILQLGGLLPTSGKRYDDDQPELADDFEPEDWIEWYEEQGAFHTDGTRETNGMRIIVTDTCLVAGHKHTGSGLTGFVIGDTFGYHCFSDDCEGSTIGTIFKILREAVDANGKPLYKEYPGQVFKDDGLEAVLEFSEVADDAEKEVVKAEEKKLDEAIAPRPVVEEGEEPVTKDGLDIKCNELATELLSIVLHHPKDVWQDGFVHYQKRIKEKLGFNPKPYKKLPDGEVGTQPISLGPGETMRMVIKFAEAFKQLPDAASLKRFLDQSEDPEVRDHQEKDKIKVFVNDLVDVPPATFDLTAQSLIFNLDLRHEVNAWRTAFNHFLLTKKNVQDARDTIKKHFNISTTQDTNFESGPWQDRTDAIYADFEKNVLGSDDGRKFITGLPSMDNSGMNIGLDGDRAICLCGPASNRKTTLALSLALNFSINGKNGLFFAGEHLPRKLLKKLTLQLSHFFKDPESPMYDPEIANIPGLSKWEGLNRTATVEDLTKIKSLLLRLKAEQLVPGYLEPQSIDAVSRGDEDKIGALLQYAEATYAKYQWDYIIIDPLDTIMPAEVASARGVNNWKLCSGIVDRLFDFSRNAFGGKGCMVIVTAQFGADARRDIERIQEKNAGQENFDDELESILKRDGLIQYFTTIGQRFDLCLGVATRTKDGESGLIVKGRDREGGTFNSLTFNIDHDTNYLKEAAREYRVLDATAKPEAMMTAEALDEL